MATFGTQRSWCAVLAVLCASVPLTAGAQGARLAERQQTFGAVLAPPVLPNGATSTYAYIGAPEVAVGYRYGLGVVELEGKAILDWFQLSLAVELRLKFAILRGGPFELAAYLAGAVVGDTGAKWLDDRNFAAVLARGSLGAIASYRLSDTLRLLGTLDIPASWALQTRGGGRFRPLVGPGIEIFLGNDVTALVAGQLGVDSMKQPGGTPDTRLGWGFQLGLGYRIF